MLTIYRASAGSGKTYTLAKDYISLLFAAANQTTLPHRQILAVTFTNKATEEMKSRILKELHTLSRGEKSPYREALMKNFGLDETEVDRTAETILIRILHDYSSFNISTIDRFFQQVVRSFAREIGISGGYNLELDTETTLMQAVDNLYTDMGEKENEQLLNWMTAFMEEQIESGKSWNLQHLIIELGKEIFKENYQHKAEEVREKLHDKHFLKHYQTQLRQIKKQFEEQLAQTADKALEILKINDLKPEYFSRAMMHKTLEKIKKGDFELKNTFLSYAQTHEKCYTTKQSDTIKQAIEQAYYSGLQQKLQQIIDTVSSDAMREYNTANLILKHLDTLGILSDLAVQIKTLTGEQNVMLLSDTNILLNKIIDNSDTPFVYERIGTTLRHYMIDEFQDTSALQWSNFKPLITDSLSESGTSMVVGDVKQSIYRWRNSDWNLLNEQINTDFAPRNIEQKTLDTNWRSDQNIVRFNNTFFHRAATILQEKLNNNIRQESGERLQQLTSKISQAYHDIEQQTAPGAGTGHVRITFVPNERKTEEWHAHCLNQIPAQLEELIERGYNPSDIAFLVRTNKEAAEVIQFLLSYKNSPQAKPKFSYDVVGNEGLLLSTAPSVGFIVAALKLAANPTDAIHRATMHFEYLKRGKKHPANEAIHLMFTDVNNTSATPSSNIFSAEENNCLSAISHQPLYTAVEQLIQTFHLNEWEGETVFLQAFQDTIFKFSNSRSADLNSFLRWWDDNGNKQMISMPENQEAFRVMTIHKSKGLDFKVVIIPFCDWELEKLKNSPLLWCTPNKSPFNEIPLLPVQYEKKLAESIFREDYFDEQMLQYVDNLNAAYVAFTRARHEMLCFAPAPTDANAPYPLEKINTLAQLMHNCLLNTPEWETYRSEDNTIFEIGESLPSPQKHLPLPTGTTRQLAAYPIASSSDRLSIRLSGTTPWKTSDTSTANAIRHGTLMHEILRETTRRGEENRAIQQMLSAGKIDENDLMAIKATLVQFWEPPQVEEWFSEENEAINEATLLLPTGEMYRPDRLVIKVGEIVVIDYKFGQEEHEYHRRQIQQYASCLTQMGYNVKEKWLYYVHLGVIREC